MDMTEQKPDINYKWGMKRLDHRGFWTNVSKRSDLTIEFIREFKEYLNWYFITINSSVIMDRDFLTEFKDKIMWRYVDRFSIRLNESLIEEFKDVVDWPSISFKKYLSDDFIWKYKDRINWQVLCKYRKLSEEFMDRFALFLDWDVVSQQQAMSNDFIERHKEEINFIGLGLNKRISRYNRNKWLNYYVRMK